METKLVFQVPKGDGRRADVIVEAAGRLFFAPGVARVSMDDLARELGMSKKTIYRHFPDRRSLLAAVLDRQFAARSARWWRRPRTQKGSRSVCGYSGF